MNSTLRENRPRFRYSSAIQMTRPSTLSNRSMQRSMRLTCVLSTATSQTSSCVRRGGCKYTVSWIDFRSGSCPRSPRAQADGRLHERREAAPDCEFDGQLRKLIKRRNTDPARWSSLIDILCRPDDPCPPESARQV